MLPKIKRLFRRGFRVLSRTAETVPSGNKDNLPSGNKEPSPPGNKEHHSQSTPKVGQQQLSSYSIERWLENVIPPVASHQQGATRSRQYRLPHRLL